MNPISWKVKAVGAAFSVAIIAGAGAGIAWWATSTNYDADIALLKKQHADDRAAWDREKTAITTKAQQDTAAAIKRTHDAQDAAAAADKSSQEKLANAKRENDALRDDVAAGRKRVSILTANLAAANRSSGNATGGSSSTSSLGNGTAIELSREAGLLIYDIREGMISDREKILYLQSYIRDVVKQCKR